MLDIHEFNKHRWKALKNKLIYLASPYSHDSKRIMESRFESVTKIGSDFVKSGYLIIAPITSSHELAKAGNITGSWKTWKKLDTKLLNCSDILIVVMLNGWNVSVGVAAEIRIAKKLKIPIYYLHEINSNLWTLQCGPHWLSLCHT